MHYKMSSRFKFCIAIRNSVVVFIGPMKPKTRTKAGRPRVKARGVQISYRPIPLVAAFLKSRAKLEHRTVTSLLDEIIKQVAILKG